MKFSIVLIAKNEEKTLPRMLTSLSTFISKGGEVIVVDTGSTDKTVDVAKKFGCAVHEVGDIFIYKIDANLATNVNEMFCVDNEEPILKEGDKLFDFSSARNYAASLAKNDMIAMPDCDEIYTKFDYNKINELIDSGIEQLEYNFVFSHDDHGNEMIKFMHSKFYNRTKMKWIRIVHEVLEGDAKRCYVDENVIKLEHFQNHETDRSNYLRGLALDCYLNKDSDRNSHYFGRELLWTRRPKSAIKELNRHVQMPSSANFKSEQAQSMIYIGDAYKMIDDETVAVQSWFNAFCIDSTRRESLLRLADHYYQKHDAQKTACYGTAALQIKNSFFYANNQYDYTVNPHDKLYWAFWNLGDFKESKKHFDIAFEYMPYSEKFLHDYRYYYDLPTVSFIIPTIGRKKSLERCIRSINDLNYPQEKIDICVIEDSPRQGVPLRVREGVNKTNGEIIVYASNDVEFTSNSLILAIINMIKNEHMLVAFNSGDLLPDNGNICAHFVIRRNDLPKIGGDIFDVDFNHIGVDNLLWAKVNNLGKASWCEHAKIIHHHFSNGGSSFDDVYNLGWNEESVKKDRELLVRKLAELNQSSTTTS